MQTLEQRPADLPPTHDQLRPAFPSAPFLADAESLLIAVLVETLAAARDTVARCERGLALLSGRQNRELDVVACAITHSGVAVVADTTTATPAGVDSTGRTYLRSTSTMAVDAVPCRVTRREADVVRLIAAGLSNKEIARALGISGRTVERHITNLYRKIGARGKADATTWAVRQHLV